MKELLKRIIFEQQENCKHLMQDAIPRHIEEEWAYHHGNPYYNRCKTMWKVGVAAATA